MSSCPLSSKSLALSASLLLGACAQPTRPPLYLWETFPKHQYETLQRSGASPQVQIQQLEAHVEKAKMGHLQLPPGLRAHLGLQYLQAGQTDAARAQWLAEKQAFPEGAPYMDQLLKRLDSGTFTPAPANAASAASAGAASASGASK